MHVCKVPSAADARGKACRQGARVRGCKGARHVEKVQGRKAVGAGVQGSGADTWQGGATDKSEGMPLLYLDHTLVSHPSANDQGWVKRVKHSFKEA
eukprot:scaffold47841_cov20-Tisochrysis_lutea.AAC.1